MRMRAVFLVLAFCAMLGGLAAGKSVKLHVEHTARSPHIELSADTPHGVSAKTVKQVTLASTSGSGKAEMHKLDETERDVEADKRDEEAEKREEVDKVKQGVEVMSEEERATTILRCRQDDEVPDPEDVVPPNVSVGIYVINLGSTDGLVSGVYYSDFLFYLRQEGKPFDSFEGVDPIDQLSFSNAKSVSGIKHYGPGTYLVSGDFFFSPDLRWYPFDQQELKIVVEQMESPITEWEFVPSDSNGLSPSVRFPGWLSSLQKTKTASRAPCKTRAGVTIYPGGSRDDPDSMNNVTYSRFSYTLKVERPIIQGLLTHIFPPVVVFLPTLYSYALAPLKDAITKMSLSGGGLISLIFIWRGISGSIPALDYLTAFDKYIFCFFISISIALSFSIACYAYFSPRDSDDPPPARELNMMLGELSSKVCWYSVGFLFFLFLPAWMFVDAAVILPLGLLGMVVGVLWCYNELEDIKFSSDNEELTGLAPSDVKLSDE